MPFTVEQFFSVFAQYNLAVWPAQLGLLVLGIGAAYFALRGPRRSRLATAILALLWLWMAGAYHAAFFSRVNPMAWLFGLAFVVQAALLVWRGVMSSALQFNHHDRPERVAALGLILYALVGYPLLGLALGHVAPAAPTFGVPCPTTIFTFGVLLLADPLPLGLLAVPVLWTAVAAGAVLSFGMLEDLGLVVAAIVVAAMLLRRHSIAHRLRRA